MNENYPTGILFGKSVRLPKPRGAVYSAERADRAVRFIETLCIHTKAEWAGVPFTLLPWQRHLVCTMFGWVDKKGARVFRTCYGELPKKNGKTELGAAIALKLLVADDERGAEVYSAAADREQASLVYLPAKYMVDKKRLLKRRLKIIDSRRRIVDHKHSSFYQVLSSEAYTKHGISPSGIIFDELHAQPNRELWDVLTEETDAARRQQFILVLTNAGIWDPQSICWEVREGARKVAEGKIEDPTMLPIIYSADKDEDWESEKVWRRVNPSMGHIFDMPRIRRNYHTVLENPHRQNNYRRFRVGQWVNQISRYIPMDVWDACAGKVEPGSLLKRPSYGGLDLSSTTDLTAFVLVFPPESDDEPYQVLVKVYMPQDNMQRRIKEDRVPYDLWERSGLLTATPGNVVDYAIIRRDINNAHKIYDLRELAVDRWGGAKLIPELQDEDGITVVDFGQGWKSMSPATKELMRLIKLGCRAKDTTKHDKCKHRMAHGGHPVLRWCADNMVVKTDEADNVKPDKKKARERIDPVVALIMAVGRAAVNTDPKSVYETRGIVTIG